jgi:hypothetical protein
MGIQRGDQTAPAASSSTTDPLVQKFGQLHVVDDLIRLRASDMVQRPILAYPSSDQNAASFAYYTGQDLDEMINQAVNVLMNDGFQPVSALNSPRS